MIDTQTIRSKILDLAMRGQLTEQLPEDGTAEELYQQIQKEKHALIQDGKLKTEKPLPAISDEEKPYNLPSNWRWGRLKELCTKIVDGDHNPPAGVQETTKYLMLSAQNINKGKLCNFDNVRYLSAAVFEEENKRTQLEVDDVLLTIVGTIGRTCVYQGGYNLCFQRSVAVISTLIDSKYLKYALDIPFVQNFMETNATGAAQLGFYLNKLEKLLIPLSPLAEQHRIVARIEQAFSALDTIDALQAKYADNLAVLKSKLIDAAIQGKLTEQLPEDGTADELYRQIQAERKRQETAGMIKTVELAPDVPETEMPFAIPSSWKWTNLGNVSYIVRGGSPRPIKQYITTREDGINWIKIGDVEKGGKYIYSTQEKIIPEGESKSRRVYPGDFLLTNSMSFGRPYISQIEGCIHDGWLLIHDLTGFDPDYLYYLLSSSYLYGQFTVKASGSTVDNLNIDKVKAALIPLPPLAEQKRIVKRLDEVLNLVEARQSVAERAAV